MKVYSEQAITKSDVDAINAEQTRQIHLLKIALAASFIINLGVTLALKFL